MLVFAARLQAEWLLAREPWPLNPTTCVVRTLTVEGAATQPTYPIITTPSVNVL